MKVEKKNFEDRFIAYTRNEYSIDRLKEFRKRIDVEISERESSAIDYEKALNLLSNDKVFALLYEYTQRANRPPSPQKKEDNIL